MAASLQALLQQSMSQGARFLKTLVGRGAAQRQQASGKRDDNGVAYTTIAPFPTGLPHMNNDAFADQLYATFKNWGFEPGANESKDMFLQNCLRRLETGNLPPATQTCMSQIGFLLAWQVVNKMDTPKHAWEYLSEWINVASSASRPAKYAADSATAPRQTAGGLAASSFASAHTSLATGNVLLSERRDSDESSMLSAVSRQLESVFMASESRRLVSCAALTATFVVALQFVVANLV